jgi:hypothetical protein
MVNVGSAAAAGCENDAISNAAATIAPRRRLHLPERIRDKSFCLCDFDVILIARLREGLTDVS